VLTPPPFARLRADWAVESPPGAEESTRFADTFATAVAELRCEVLDLAGVARHTDIDGIHFDADQHELIGRAVAAQVQTLLPTGA